MPRLERAELKFFNGGRHLRRLCCLWGEICQIVVISANSSTPVNGLNVYNDRSTMKEMVGGCCVCSDERGWDENPLVYCDGHGCNVAVHQGTSAVKLTDATANSI